MLRARIGNPDEHNDLAKDHKARRKPASLGDRGRLSGRTRAACTARKDARRARWYVSLPRRSKSWASRSIWATSWPRRVSRGRQNLGRSFGCARRLSRGLSPGRSGLARSAEGARDDACARRRHAQPACKLPRLPGCGAWWLPAPRAPSPSVARRFRSPTSPSLSRRAVRHLALLPVEDLSGKAGPRSGDAAWAEIVCVNPSLLLGPGDRRGSSTEDVRKFLVGEIAAIPSGGLSFVDVRDAASACLSAMERGRPGRAICWADRTGPLLNFSVAWAASPRSKVRGCACRRAGIRWSIV